MKKTAVLMSLILLLNLFAFITVLAEQQQSITTPAVASGEGHVLGLNKYGRVFAAGDNTYGQCFAYNWIDVTQIAAGKYFSAGLCSDGSVVLAGKKEDGNEFSDIDVSGLGDIKQISAGDNFLAALDKNGRVYVAGDEQLNEAVALWENVTKIACGAKHIAGITSAGECVGAGSAATNLDAFSNIIDIYAGANLTVLKDVEGMYYHAGATVDATGYEDFDVYWKSRDWDNISKIVISPLSASQNNGVVTAIKNDGSVVTDNVDGYVVNNGLSGVKDLAVGNGYAIYIDMENRVNLIGERTEDLETQMEFENQIAEFDLEMEPLREVYIKKPQVVVATNTVAIVLPNGQVKGIGAKDLSDFERVHQLSADMGFGETDIFMGVDKDGRVISNLDDASWLNDWMNTIKVAPTACHSSQKWAVGLRWDKRLLCYGSDINSLEIEDVVDVACGKGFLSYVKGNGEVGVYEKTPLDTRKAFEVGEWSDIKSISNGIYHIAALKNDGTCVATGGFISKKDAGKTGECNVSGWSDIKDILCGEGFTIALRNDGMCEFTGWDTVKEPQVNELKNIILKTDETDTEYWQNVSEIYALAETVVAYKEDGTFDYVTSNNSADFSLLENTYYKDDVFYTYKTEGNTAEIEYYSADSDLEVYFSYFDANGRPVGFEKKVLPAADTLTKKQFTTDDKYSSFTMSIGQVKADEIKFYMEHEEENGTVKIRHCAAEGQRIMLAFYDDFDNMLDIKVRTLAESSAITEAEFSCKGATKYKLFIRDGATPLYKAEGQLN